MKTASPALIKMLEENTKFICCDLYTMTLTNGIVLYITTADIPIRYNGHTFDNTLLTKRDDLEFSTGINVDTMSFYIYPKPTNLVGSLTYHKAFRNGTFDGAILQLDKAFFNDWKSTPEVLEKVFVGQMEVDEISRTEIKVAVNSLNQILNIDLPRNVYQSSCPWMLYEENTCKVAKELYTFKGLIEQTSTIRTLYCNLRQLDGYFDQGVIEFISGSNINIKRTVKTYTSGVITLTNPLLYAPSVDDSFILTRGCNGTMTDCVGKFNNLANFGGQPFVPEAESTY